MSRKIPMIGKKYNKLTVIREVDRPGKELFYECLCECGNTKVIRGRDVRRGHTESCGCNFQESIKKVRTTHGMSFTRPHRAYQNMRKRCDNPNNKSYKDYGGRGITYCDEWKTFEGFWNDMQEGYVDNLSLDRIDYNGNYCKENCRWVDMKTQANNTRSNRLIAYNGETLTLSETAEKYNIKYGLLLGRLHLGWDIEKAITQPAHTNEELTYKGITKTVHEFAADYGMTYHQLKKRLMRGWDIERALTQPLRKSSK